MDNKIHVDKYILMVDNRADKRLLRINDQKGFRWRKIQINLKELPLYQYYQKIQVINGTFKQAQHQSEDQISEEELNDNRQIYTLEEPQKLQPQQIEQLKKNLKPSQIIQSITNNNDQFQKRTNYSKEKYIKKKQRKYLFLFHAQPTNPSNLHAYYYQNQTVNIRWDMLAFLLLEASPIQHLLLAEQNRGMIAGSSLARGAKSVHLLTHQTKHHHYNIPQQLNLSQEQLKSFHIKNWNQLSTLTPIFTNLIIAGNYNFKQIISVLVPLLKSGSPIILYSPTIEPLSECVEVLQGLKCIRVRVYDGWSRKYQVLKNRTHPMMTMDSQSGYVLCGIKAG